MEKIAMKYFIAVLLCASLAYAEPGAEVSVPDNVTRHKIKTEKIHAGTLTASNFSMPVMGHVVEGTADTEKIIDRVSIEAFDNPFYDTSIPPKLINNPMLELGINIERGAKKVKGKPSMRQGMELSYQTTSLNPSAGSRAYSEWYVSGSGADGKAFRPFGFGWDTDNHTKYTRLAIAVGKQQGFYILGVDDYKMLFSFLGTGVAYIPNVVVEGQATLGDVEVKGKLDLANVEVTRNLTVGETATFGKPLSYGFPAQAQFSPNGQLKLEGYARVRKALIVPVSGTGTGDAGPASEERSIGASGGIKAPVLSFSKTKEQSVYVEFHAPLDMDDAADVELHALWQPAAGWTRGNCVWNFEYLVKDKTGDFTTGTPAKISSETRPSKVTEMQNAVFTTQLDVNKGQVIMGRFYRDVGSDDGNAAAELRCLEITYIANKLGEVLW
jgi:hypothetical protein